MAADNPAPKISDAVILAEIEDVPDDGVIIRAIDTHHIHEFTDADHPAIRRRVSKSAFSPSSLKVDPEQGMSVDLWSKLEALGIDPTSDTYAPNREVLMVLNIADVIELGLDVVHRPVDENRAHCNVLGVHKPKFQKALLSKAGWLRRPPDLTKL